LVEKVALFHWWVCRSSCYQADGIGKDVFRHSADCGGENGDVWALGRALEPALTSRLPGDGQPFVGNAASGRNKADITSRARQCTPAPPDWRGLEAPGDPVDSGEAMQGGFCMSSPCRASGLQPGAGGQCELGPSPSTHGAPIHAGFQVRTCRVPSGPNFSAHC